MVQAYLLGRESVAGQIPRAIRAFSPADNERSTCTARTLHLLENIGTAGSAAMIKQQML